MGESGSAWARAKIERLIEQTSKFENKKAQNNQAQLKRMKLASQNIEELQKLFKNELTELKKALLSLSNLSSDVTTYSEQGVNQSMPDYLKWVEDKVVIDLDSSISKLSKDIAVLSAKGKKGEVSDRLEAAIGEIAGVMNKYVEARRQFFWNVYQKDMTVFRRLKGNKNDSKITGILKQMGFNEADWSVDEHKISVIDASSIINSYIKAFKIYLRTGRTVLK